MFCDTAERAHEEDSLWTNILSTEIPSLSIANGRFTLRLLEDNKFPEKIDPDKTHNNGNSLCTIHMFPNH